MKRWWNWVVHPVGRGLKGVRDRAEQLPSVAGHAYAALGGVFLVVGLFSIERAAINNRKEVVVDDATPVAYQHIRRPVPIAPLESTADDVPSDRKSGTRPEPPPAAAEEKNGNPLPALDPWRYFHPTWQAEAPEQQLRRHRTGWLFFGPDDMPVAVEKLVDDPNGRLEAEFRVPPYLRERVLFWMRVHSSYGNRMRLVHDRDNLGIIYGYLDFRPLYRAAVTTAEGDALAYRAEARVMKELRARLAEAAGLRPPGSTRQTVRERDLARLFLSSIGKLRPSDAAETIAHIRTQTGQRDEFLAALRRSRELLPHIASVFRASGLPVALARIPFVESSFNARARSKVGAVGIWQFMPATARQMMGWNRATWADPLKQTVAATKLLRLFRSMLPDWSTSVTAYNSGVGRLKRLTRSHHAKNLAPLVAEEGDDEDGLGFAGENFYAQFLSANLIEAYKEELFQHWAETPDFSIVFQDALPGATPLEF